MELRQLKYFVRIVDAGSISKAAESLHVAQPALSLQIRNLEDELGVKLFTRSSRGVLPTERGMALGHQARQILAQIEALHLVARQSDKGPAGPVTVGLPGTVVPLLGLPLLHDIRNHYPSVHLRIVEGPSWYLTELVSSGKIDLAVIFDAKAKKGLDLTRLLTEPLLFVGKSGTLRGRTEIGLNEAAQIPLILFSRPNGIREVLEAMWKRHQIKPIVVAEIDSPRLLVEAVEAGLGFSMLPAYRLDSSISKGKIEAITYAGGSCKRTVSIASSVQRGLSAAALCVQERVLEHIRNAVLTGLWPANWKHGEPSDQLVLADALSTDLSSP